MSHPLLEHRAVLALCRRSAWVGDWRELCARNKREFDIKRFNAERAFESLDELRDLPDDDEGREVRRKIFEPYETQWVERDHRLPPLPFKADTGRRPDDGCCCICNQPIYSKRSHKPNWGPRREDARWHAICYSAYATWTAPQYLAQWLAARQRGICTLSGQAVARWVELAPNDWRRGKNPYPNHPRWKNWKPSTHEWRTFPDVQVDHVVPLWKVAQMVASWPRVLNYWGPGNLQLVSETAHKGKCRAEARERATLRLGGQQEALW